MADRLDHTSSSTSSYALLVARSPVFRAAGSLRFAAVLLMLWLVGMACATVYESTHSAERALAVFYTSWWFKAILALIGVNVLAAMIVRYPFSKRQIGFVLTHAGILVTLGGAAVTDRYAVNGQIGFFEGETAQAFTARGVSVLTVANRRDQQQQESVDLTAGAFAGFREVEQPDAPVLKLGDLNVEVERFLPDSERVRLVVDDDPHRRPAVEVSLSASGEGDPVWLFAGEPARVGTTEGSFTAARSAEELRDLLAPAPGPEPLSSGTVKIEFAGSGYDIPLQDCLDRAVPVGDTGTTVRVLRYLPHAVVEGKQLVNKSNRPENPAIVAEIIGPSGVEHRKAFAKFPDFQSMHGEPQLEGLRLTFVAPQEDSPPLPVEVLGGPADELYVRFRPADAGPVLHKLEVGVPVESPWPGMKFAVLRCFEHARLDWTVEAVDPVREERQPALLLKLSTEDDTHTMWVQKFASIPMTLDGVTYELAYGSKRLPLGFKLTLDRFRLGRYPGSMRPRSFESRITIADANTGETYKRVVGMNRPVEYGGYSLYQSRYKQLGDRSASFLSVARDPGLPVVFAGYTITLLGMVVVLGTRMADWRKAARLRKG